ncbi:hypothetical protein QRD02_10860 [Aequorivita sp. SDUM287046]|uniref:Uncharacterized protein n=1 Tax=Aequorivita aurantiaca TaxID=3053356 RepID=A0ABT8DLV9_9FLAO|nr:hypothetical protein [Aequorivita aurantiaca]MDN3724885.1 hypothetical protein [Aequorivita aurantiaca]
MKTITYFTLLFISLNASAQTFSWGFPFGRADETEKNITHVVADDKLYRISSKYDLGTFNQKVTVDQFSLNDLEKTGSRDLSVEQPMMGVASLTFNSMFQKEGSQFIFFYTDYDRKTKKNKLLFRKVNINSGKLGELQTVLETDTNDGRFFVSQSDNKQYFAVLNELPFAKKSNEKVEFFLLDGEAKILKQKTHQFEIEDNRDKQHSLYVSNNGLVILVKKVDEKKVKPYLNLYTWNTSEDTIATTSLQQQDDYQIPQFEGKFHEDNFYFLAVITHEKSSNFGLKIDMNGRNSGVGANGILAVKVDAQGNVAYTQRNDFEKIVSNLNLKDFLFSGDGIWAVYDRMYVEKKSSSSNLTAGDFSYDYSYLNNGFVVTKLDINTGKMEWSRIIDTSEPNTKNDNGDFLSTLFYMDGGNMVLLYNETRDLNTAKIHVVFNRRFPIKEVISATGETLSREALLAAGIGVTKEEEFELNPAYLIPVSENTFIIRASNRVEYKYGKMKI